MAGRFLWREFLALDQKHDKFTDAYQNLLMHVSRDFVSFYVLSLNLKLPRHMSKFYLVTNSLDHPSCPDNKSLLFSIENRS